MFLERIPYTTLSSMETIIIIAFVTVMMIATFNERRTWILLTYTVLGFILTVVSMLQISIEVKNGISEYHTSVLMAVVAALCTTMWAILYGTRKKE